jgi:hypothetical protein
VYAFPALDSIGCYIDVLRRYIVPIVDSLLRDGDDIMDVAWSSSPQLNTVDLVPPTKTPSLSCSDI